MDKDKSTDFVYGRWPVKEALEAGPVSKILVALGTKGSSLQEVIRIAKKKKVPFHWVERRKIDQLAGDGNQGVMAYVSPMAFTDIHQLVDHAFNAKKQGPCLLFLDGIQDPQNVGSILRSAVFFGVAGVVIPKWRAAPMTGTIMRSSAGAARMVPIARVSNLASAMDIAKKKGIWLAGADMDGEEIKKADFGRPIGLVMGSEGEGLHRLVREKCDYLVRISGDKGRKGIDSLNVSVASAVLLHQLS